MSSLQRATSAVVCAAFLAHPVAAMSEEGFWTFSDPPAKAVERVYGYGPQQRLLDHLMRSAARFDSGGNSGAFVSADGLWLTNFHIGRTFVRRMAGGAEIMKDGFYASRPDQEIKLPEKVPGLDVTIRLASVESVVDVTRRVHSAKPGAERDEVIKKIEAEVADSSHRGQIVKLHGGAIFQLQRLKLYTDVRLVFFPEAQIGLLEDSSDAEGPEFPDGYDLDVAIFRIYENGKPVKPKHWLRWSIEPVKDGDLVFASGTPGMSARGNSMSWFQLQRDVKLPFRTDMARRLELALRDFVANSATGATRAGSSLSEAIEARRSTELSLRGFQDERRLAEPKSNERALRGVAPDNPAWAALSAATTELAAIWPRALLLGDEAGFGSELFKYARMIVRLDEERAKPEVERLPIYRDLAKVERDISEEKSVDRDLEKVRIGTWLKMMADHLGLSDPIVQNFLAGKSPDEAAAAFARSQIADAQWRKSMLKPGAGSSANNEFVAAVRGIDAESRRLQSKVVELEGRISAAHDQLAQARFAAFGRDIAPDANSTLRFTYGTVQGWTQDGTLVPAWSTIGGMWKYLDTQDRITPLNLPKSWTNKRPTIKSETPFNFVSTLDCVAGSSGTPIVNRHGRFVGVLNKVSGSMSAASYLRYAPRNRCIAVSNTAIIEALRSVYGADQLADELVRGRRG